jgi:hypothetical protein
MRTLTEGIADEAADAHINERRKHPVFRIYSRIPGNEVDSTTSYPEMSLV